MICETQTNALRVRSEQAEADSQTAHAALLRLGEENAALRVRSNELAGLKQEVEKEREGGEEFKVPIGRGAANSRKGIARKGNYCWQGYK